MYKEVSVYCKQCGHTQVYLQTGYGDGRQIRCQECDSLLVRRKPKPILKVEPIWIVNKFDTYCRRCKQAVSKGSEVLWTPGQKHVLCKNCGGK